jgi:iron complex transport system substrate-binding protein
MKKVVTLILIITLTACIFAGCGNSKVNVPSDSATSETRTITDSAGRTVDIPSTVGKIFALGNAPRMITYLGLADKVVGISGMASDQITPVTAYAYANKDLWANVPLVGTDAAGATDYYPEEIIADRKSVV